MVVIGVPFSFIDIEAGSVGSDKRAIWICRWIEDTLAAGTVRMHDFASVIGLLNFAMAAIDHLRPFLDPLYASACLSLKQSLLCFATLPTCCRMARECVLLSLLVENSRSCSGQTRSPKEKSSAWEAGL